MAYIEYTLFAVGIFLLIKGADYLIDGASSLAKKLGVSTLVIGLTIVAFGTSMPELIVNVLAALQGAGQVALGNIIGSNISNILLVLGVTAIIYNVKVHRTTTWKEIPFALLSVIILFILTNKFILNKEATTALTRTDGLILLSFFVIFIFYSFDLMIKTRKKTKEKTKLDIVKHNNFMIAILIIGGLVALYLGGRWTVNGAVFIANQFGLSQFLISATILALGTSLPELVTSVKAALRKDVDLAMGTILGSNIFNIFWILGLTAVIRPVEIPSFINTDIIILICASLALFLTMFTGKPRHELERWEGILFVLAYIAYITFLIIRG